MANPKQPSAEAVTYSTARRTINLPSEAHVRSQIGAVKKRIAELELLFASEPPKPIQKTKKRSKWQAKLKRWMARLSNSRTELIRLQGRLTRLQDQLGLISVQTDMKYVREYEEICEIPRVVRAYIDSPNLLIETDDLFGKDDRVGGKWHRIGRFKICYNLRTQSSGDIRWLNMSELFFDGFAAPTGVNFCGSSACQGTLIEPLADAQRNNDVVTIVKLLVRFVECPGSGYRITKWPVVSKKEVPQWYLEMFE